MSTPQNRRTALQAARRFAIWLAIAGVLAAVFAAYLSPHLVVDLANRVWACF